MKTVVSHSLDQGSVSVDDAVLDENIFDGDANVCLAVEESQTDERRGLKATIRNADVECVRDRMMNLKQERKKSEIT